jgi:Flp pilus assembly secretin CpaC
MVHGAVAPIDVPPKIPYVYELPSQDTFVIPKQYSGEGQGDKTLVSFENTSSTEERNTMVAVGTPEDLQAIQAFVASIDKPARRIMIEIQVIELEASKLLDYGFDGAQFGSGHHIGNIGLPLPGEPIIQPGLGEDVRRDPNAFVPPVLNEGFEFIFDDTSVDLSGRFLATIHALVREGEAKVKARPKILTLDDRTSVLHLGRELPTFVSTGITRDAFDGNLISEVRQLTKEYVGMTLNLRPRVTGGADDEVSLQIELIANELVERQRVFEEDLIGVPATNRRHYFGENRVKNHRPMILGGLIQEQEVESVNKIPLLGDIPLLGYLFRRTQKAETRREIILVVTPHILSDRDIDPAATPKESIHFDTFDSVLFNDRHIIKGSDVLGIDPINNAPAPGFQPDQILDLTLLNIVKKRELVSKLNVLEDYLGDDAAELSWIQRKWPEATAKDWPEKEQELYFRAAAICIDNIKDLNPDLTYEELMMPRREIVLPTSPYRISLSYDRVKSLQQAGAPLIFRGEYVALDQTVVEMLKDASGRSLRNFADFLERRERKAEEHVEMLAEIKRFYRNMQPESNALEGISYPDVYRALERAGLDFLSLASHFQTSLDERYVATTPPDVGLFKKDLEAFLKTAVGLVQRARELKELEEKWQKLNELPEEETEETEETEEPEESAAAPEAPAETTAPAADEEW